MIRSSILYRHNDFRILEEFSTHPLKDKEEVFLWEEKMKKPKGFQPYQPSAAFQSRLDREKPSLEKFERYAAAEGIVLHRIGFEAVVADATMRCYLRLLARVDPSLGALRYMPDYLVETTTDLVFAEIKASAKIEQAAYEAYVERNRYVPVFLVLDLGAEDTLYRVRVRDIVWRHDGWLEGSEGGSGTPFNEIHLGRTPKQRLHVPESR